MGYAWDEFPMTARLASFVALMWGELTQQAEAAALFLPDRAVPAPGAKLVDPDLAGALPAIAAAGWAGFYRDRLGIGTLLARGGRLLSRRRS